MLQASEEKGILKTGSLIFEKGGNTPQKVNKLGRETPYAFPRPELQSLPLETVGD